MPWRDSYFSFFRLLLLHCVSGRKRSKMPVTCIGQVFMPRHCLFLKRTSKRNPKALRWISGTVCACMRPDDVPRPKNIWKLPLTGKFPSLTVIWPEFVSNNIVLSMQWTIFPVISVILMTGKRAERIWTITNFWPHKPNWVRKCYRKCKSYKLSIVWL